MFKQSISARFLILSALLVALTGCHDNDEKGTTVLPDHYN